MPPSKKDHCYDDLKHRVLSLDLAPGSGLDEASLSQSYGLSRTPLREVFQRLAGEGFLSLETNRGAVVSSMDLGSMRCFFETAPLIYASVARLAAENRTAAQLDMLKEIQKEFLAATAAGDAGEASIHNHRFHAQIGEMAQNPYLLPSLNRMLIDHTRLSQTFYRPASPSESVLVVKAGQHHDQMISAFEARESALAVDITLQHWDLSRDRLERFVRPDPLPIDVISLKDKRNAL